MENKEHIYDEKISPIVKQLLAVCKEEGIPMFATFQFDGCGFCTSSLRENGHPMLEYLVAMQQCTQGEHNVNIDRFLKWVCKSAIKEGHHSFYLMQLGIPFASADDNAVD